MTNPNLRINEFINRAQLEIINKLEERFTCLKQFNSTIENFRYYLLTNLTNYYRINFPFQRIVSLHDLSINTLYFWRLIEIIVEFSFHVQEQQQSSYDLDQLNILETSLLSHIELLNEYHGQRCDLLSQSSSVLIHEFDEKNIY